MGYTKVEVQGGCNQVKHEGRLVGAKKLKPEPWGLSFG